jgi:hypothetical protein
MGTFGNWIHVVSNAVFWAFCMWIWDMGNAPYPRLRRSAAGFLVGGLVIGLYDVVGWRALHFPLIFITVPALALGVWLGRSARPDSPTHSDAATK